MKRSCKKCEKNPGLSAISPGMIQALAPTAGNVANNLVDNVFTGLQRSVNDVCGKKPILFGRKRWEQCVQDVNQAELDAAIKMSATGSKENRNQSFFEKNKTPILIGGGIIATLAIGYAVYKKK